MIHDILEQAGIDKNSIIETLFSDALFRHILANLLFHSKILGKSKLENFLYKKVQKLIEEHQTEKNIKKGVDSIQSKIQEKIKKLKSVRQQYHEEFE